MLICFFGGNEIIILVVAHTNFSVFTSIYEKLTKLLQFFYAKQVNTKVSTNKECC